MLIPLCSLLVVQLYEYFLKQLHTYKVDQGTTCSSMLHYIKKTRALKVVSDLLCTYSDKRDKIPGLELDLDFEWWWYDFTG